MPPAIPGSAAWAGDSIWVPLPLEGAPHFGLYAPRDADAVLAAMSEAELDHPSQRLPYFASLWPAGLALAHELFEGPSLAGEHVLDLGCGLGSAGLAAACRGAHVSFVDWEARALEFVVRSAARLGVPVAQTLCLSFDEFAAQARTEGGPPRFDRILAADVLYEVRMIDPVARCLKAWLAPEGEAWVADPWRSASGRFADDARRAGLQVGAARERCVEPGPLAIRIWPVRRGD